MIITPFYKIGHPRYTLLIDFDYPYWHTQEDTLDINARQKVCFLYFSVVTEMIQ